MLTAASVFALGLAAAGALVSGPAAAASHEVVIEGMAFVPAQLKVKQGDMVVWVNKDMFAHTASAQDRSFDTGEMAPGDRKAFVAAKRGTVPYVCTFHPSMKGMLIVQ
jgi:plastocyanin